MVRTSVPDLDITAAVQQAVWTEDPDQPIEGPSRIASWVRDTTASLRFVVVIGAAFSVLGALLGFTGVFGLTADVSQRAIREIGIRKALGATTARILRLFVHRSVRLCLPAVVAGSFAGVGVLRLIASEIGPTAASALWSIPLVAGGFAALVVTATFLLVAQGCERRPGADDARGVISARPGRGGALADSRIPQPNTRTRLQPARC